MRFRMLNKDELEANENELIQFLIVNGVDGPEWERLNTNYPEKALSLVELFSDVVWLRILEKTTHLEFRSVTKLFVFECGADEIELIALQADSDEVNLSTPEQIHYSLLTFPGQIQFFTQKKQYRKNREDELFDMISSGCVNSSVDFFSALKRMKHDE